MMVMSVLVGGVAAAEPVTVNSLEALLPYLAQDKVEVKLAPGTYTVSAQDAAGGKFGVQGFQDKTKTIFLFEGSNSTYDFTGVTINVETKVYSSLGRSDVYIIQVQGNKNVIKNLTLLDVGTTEEAPSWRATNVVMDGRENRIEGLTMTVMGAYPYGYGELFGKGGGSVIAHRKHCAVLVRGLSNHLLNANIDHHSYGHAIYMQAADKPIIEGCTVVGRMRSTNSVLAEKGTGSDADQADFMTYFGYRVPRNYMISLGEEGIRAYSGGNTYIDGETFKRGASNVTVLNCTVKNMRGGVTLTHAKGKRYVKGTTALGCSRGFAIGSGDIIDCYADIQYGPALGVDYDGDAGMNAEITLLPHEGETVNGAGQVAYLIGNKHKVVLHNKIDDPDRKLVIQVGGKKRHIGGLDDKKIYAARGIHLNNESGFRVVLDKAARDCVVQSVGPVKDAGKKNEVKRVRN